MARVLIRQEAYEAGELDLVPRDQLKAALRQLRDRPDSGKPLERLLRGCRSLRIGGAENRLVYRYHRDRDEVEIIAIGRRRDDEAYGTAQNRL